jgi:glycosyltransferase involved in cell wall biosynthesis
MHSSLQRVRVVERSDMSRKLAILMISPQFRPMIGGYERAAERLAVELVRRGHGVTVIAERRHRNWARNEQLECVEIRRLWCFHRPGFHVLTSLFAFAAYILWYGSRYDILHVHQYGNHAAMVVVLGWLLRKPVVLKITSTAEEGIASTLATRTWRARLVAVLLRKVDLCLATTRPAAEEAVRFGISAMRVTIIPNGIDTTIYRPCESAVKESLRVSYGVATAPVALYLGRLSHAKNPEGLIDAWVLLSKRMPNAQLIMVGDGPLRALVESRIQKYGLGHVVTVVGEQQTAYPWYGLADLFVLPSRYEGLSNSLLEAMSCGLCIVSTEVSGSTEILSACDLGELVPVGDNMALADAIVRLLTDPERRAVCGARARQYAEDNFSIAEVARKMEKLYIRLLDKSVPVA